MVSFTVTLVWKGWYIVGAYVPPNNLPAVHKITHALACGPEGVRKMLVGDLNTCLAHPSDQRKEYLETIIASHGLIYQARHFTPGIGVLQETKLTGGIHT